MSPTMPAGTFEPRNHMLPSTEASHLSANVPSSIDLSLNNIDLPPNAAVHVNIEDLIDTKARHLARLQCDKDVREIAMPTGQGKNLFKRLCIALSNPIVHPIKTAKMLAHRANYERKVVIYTDQFKAKLQADIENLHNSPSETCALLSESEKTNLVKRFLGVGVDRNANLKRGGIEKSVVDNSETANKIKHALINYIRERNDPLIIDKLAVNNFRKAQSEICKNFKPQLDNYIDYANQTLLPRFIELRKSFDLKESLRKLETEIVILAGVHEHVIKDKARENNAQKLIRTVRQRSAFRDTLISAIANPATIAISVGAAFYAAVATSAIRIGAVASAAAFLGVSSPALIGVGAGTLAGALAAGTFAYLRQKRETDAVRKKQIASNVIGEERAVAAGSIDEKVSKTSYNLASATNIIADLDIADGTLLPSWENIRKITKTLADLYAREKIEDQLDINQISYGQNAIEEETLKLMYAKFDARKWLDTHGNKLQLKKLNDTTQNTFGSLLSTIKEQNSAYEKIRRNNGLKSAFFTAGTAIGMASFWGILREAGVPGIGAITHKAHEFLTRNRTAISTPPVSFSDASAASSLIDSQLKIGATTNNPAPLVADPQLNPPLSSSPVIAEPAPTLPPAIEIPPSSAADFDQILSNHNNVFDPAQSPQGLQGHPSGDFYLHGNHPSTDEIEALKLQGYEHAVVTETIKGTPKDVNSNINDYLENNSNHPAAATISKHFHYDHGANERQLHMGGKNAAGLTTDGNVVYDVSRMKAKGSWFGHDYKKFKDQGYPARVDALAHVDADPTKLSGGRLEMLVRPDNHSNQVFRIPAEIVNGHVEFHPEKHLPKDLYQACWDTTGKTLKAKVTVETGITWENPDGSIAFGEIATDLRKGIKEIHTQIPAETSTIENHVFRFRGIPEKPIAAPAVHIDPIPAAPKITSLAPVIEKTTPVENHTSEILVEPKVALPQLDRSPSQNYLSNYPTTANYQHFDFPFAWDRPLQASLGSLAKKKSRPTRTLSSSSQPITQTQSDEGAFKPVTSPISTSAAAATTAMTPTLPTSTVPSPVAKVAPFNIPAEPVIAAPTPTRPAASPSLTARVLLTPTPIAPPVSKTPEEVTLKKAQLIDPTQAHHAKIFEIIISPGIQVRADMSKIEEELSKYGWEMWGLWSIFVISFKNGRQTSKTLFYTNKSPEMIKIIFGMEDFDPPRINMLVRTELQIHLSGSVARRISEQDDKISIILARDNEDV